MTPRVRRHFRAEGGRESAWPPVESGGSGTKSSEGSSKLRLTYSGLLMERGVVEQATLHHDEVANDDRVRAPRRWWILVLRLAISIAMLGVLLWRVPRFSVDQLVPV